MARILITTWPFPGHLFPQVAVGRALRDRGHEVAFYTGARAARVLASESLAHFPFQRIDEDHLYDVVFNPHRGSLGWSGLRRFGGTLRGWLLDTIPAQVEDLRRVVAAWRPDVIVTDPTMWAPILVLHELLSLPVAVSSFVPACMVPGRDAPPFGLGLPPPRSWCSRAVARAATWGTAALTRGFRRRANELRRRYQLPPIMTSVTEHAGGMPLYLVPSVPEFDYGRRDVPPSVRYVGPFLWNSPADHPAPDWLSEVPRDQPWVHVSEGTVHYQAPVVLRAAARGLGGGPFQVLMTTGGDREPDALGLGPLASNVRVARWISHRDLLPRTDVVVTTGGAGTVLAALGAGVPLVIVPTEWDKPEIARRVVEAGAGLWLSPSRCSPRRLRAAVERVLADRSFRERARRLAAGFSAAGGAARAAELIEALAPHYHCERGPSSARPARLSSRDNAINEGEL
jgi:MGT family glycosyltransferase